MSPEEKETPEAEEQPAAPAETAASAEPVQEEAPAPAETAASAELAPEQAPAPAETAAAAEPAPEQAPAPAETAVAAEPRRERPPVGAERPERPRTGPGDRRRRHFGRRKVCAFCVEHVQAIDYKDAAKLRRYLSDRARIEARRKTGTCAKHQRWLALALKRARHLALLPYTPEHIRVTGMFATRR